MITIIKANDDYCVRIYVLRSQSKTQRDEVVEAISSHAATCEATDYPAAERIILRYMTKDDLIKARQPCLNLGVKMRGHTYERPVLIGSALKDKPWVRPRPRDKHVKLELCGVEPFCSNLAPPGKWDVVLELNDGELIETGLDFYY